MICSDRISDALFNNFFYFLKNKDSATLAIVKLNKIIKVKLPFPALTRYWFTYCFTIFRVFLIPLVLNILVEFILIKYIPPYCPICLLVVKLLTANCMILAIRRLKFHNQKRMIFSNLEFRYGLAKFMK